MCSLTEEDMGLCVSLCERGSRVRVFRIIVRFYWNGRVLILGKTTPQLSIYRFYSSFLVLHGKSMNH